MTLQPVLETIKKRQWQIPGPMTPLKYQALAVSTAAVGFTLPTLPDNYSYAIIRVETNAVRWRDDGTDPTAAVGMPMNANDVMNYSGDVSKIKFIRQSADATVHISFYG